MPSNYSNVPTDKLGTVVNYLTLANKSLRQIIEESKDDESGRLEEFDNHLQELGDKLEKFRLLNIKHIQRAEELRNLLQRQLDERTQTKNKLTEHIEFLKRAIVDQSLENDKLGRDLKENVEKLQKLHNNSNSIYTYSPNQNSSSVNIL